MPLADDCSRVDLCGWWNWGGCTHVGPGPAAGARAGVRWGLFLIIMSLCATCHSVLCASCHNVHAMPAAATNAPNTAERLRHPVLPLYVTPLLHDSRDSWIDDPAGSTWQVLHSAFNRLSITISHGWLQVGSCMGCGQPRGCCPTPQNMVKIIKTLVSDECLNCAVSCTRDKQQC